MARITARRIGHWVPSNNRFPFFGSPNKEFFWPACPFGKLGLQKFFEVSFGLAFTVEHHVSSVQQRAYVLEAEINEQSFQISHANPNTTDINGAEKSDLACHWTLKVETVGAKLF